MKFGEKIRTLRTEKKMSQTKLGEAVGVTLRTVRGWEVEGKYPQKRELYQKLADVLDCDVNYLLTETESFITDATEQYGSRGAKQAQTILEQTAFMDEIHALYLDSKIRAKKFTPKKYLKDKPSDQ